MRREAASTRVVPRGILVPVGRGFFYGLVRGGPPGDSARSCAEGAVRRACQAGWYREWPSSRAGEGHVAWVLGFGSLGGGENGDEATPPSPQNLTPHTQNPRRTGCG